MENWTENIQKALDYMESHLTKKLEIREIARQAYLSPFYFQRIFGALCGISVGEYIRARRLTLAGQDLAVGKDRVIHVAARYGYDSPDSFSRAFQRFHGMTPSAARKPGANLRNFDPIKINPPQEVCHMPEYRIVEKPPFTVVGVSRKFHPETSYQKIPEYWTEMMETPGFPLMGMYGICLDGEEHGEVFDYWIADSCIPGQEIPRGCKSLVIPGGTWAVFPCKLKTLQDTNTKMWQQWLPGCREYTLAGSYNVEMYGPLCPENPGESYAELWLPVKKRNIYSQER